MRDWARDSEGGFTLIELMVVLVLMTVAVGIVAPAIITRPAGDSESDLARVVRHARTAAANRGETVYLRVASSGYWRLEGATSPTEGALDEGAMADYAGPAATIVVSPVGTCGFDVRSTAAWNVIALDPMTCEIVRS